MPRGGFKGNVGRSKPKLRSDDMTALMMIDKDIQTKNEDSPEVNKKNIRLLEKQDKAKAVANNLLTLAGVIDKEIGMLDRKALKNEVAVDLDDVTDKGLLRGLRRCRKPAVHTFLLFCWFGTDKNEGFGVLQEA